MDDARGFRKVPASVPDLLHASPRSSRELGWQRRKLVLGALLASISAVALLRVGVRPTRASDRLAADDPWDYLDDHLPPDDSLTASASLASDRLFRLGRAGRAPSPRASDAAIDPRRDAAPPRDCASPATPARATSS